MLDKIFAPTFAITYKCSMFRHCAYCYAKEFALSEFNGKELEVDEFKRLMRWFLECDAQEVVFVGGEPTVHHDFFSLLDAVKELNIKARMFTNGFYSDRKSKAICANKNLATLFFHFDEHYLITVGGALNKRYADNLEALASSGKNIYLRCNFNEKDFEFKKLIQLAVRYKAKICYSFTTPAPGVDVYCKITEYRGYFPRYRKFVKEAMQKGVTLSLARPLPLCMFNDAEEIKFFKKHADLQSTCEAIYDLTVNPDSSLQLCLVTFSIRTKPVKSKADLIKKIDYLKAAERHLHESPPTEECRVCSYFPHDCQGGCFGFHIYSQEVPRKFSYKVV